MAVDGQTEGPLYGFSSNIPSDRQVQYWTTNQSPHESVQDWETRIRQTCNMCNYAALTDEICWDKFVFGLHDSYIRTELLKYHLKPDKTQKSLSDVVGEARAFESARQTNKLIGDTNKTIEENVNWVTKKAHKVMKLKREPGTCQWCGDRHGPHSWKDCPAYGRTCMRCSSNDHFARVCLEASNQQSQTYQPSRVEAEAVEDPSRTSVAEGLIAGTSQGISTGALAHLLQRTLYRLMSSKSFTPMMVCQKTTFNTTAML